jgi:hypothetical protein
MEFNISGGYLAKVNITATTQNPHWKAFLGWVNGQFTLEDAAGYKIYDWSLTSVRGYVHATRKSTIANWSGIGCATEGQLEAENVALSHNSTDDNITKTFNDGAAGTHPAFVVGSKSFESDECPALNTYVNSTNQSTSFFEMAMYDGASIIYSTIINRNTAGYDNQFYDFQMIVPENGSETWAGITPYYLYVELT